MSQNLVFSMLYLTFTTGEKLASTSNTSTSSSLSFNSSTVRYQAHFSTLISIFNSKPSWSISVIYKSLFKISTPAGVSISAAVTFQDVFFESFNHSIHVSHLLKTNHFKLSIISIILSLTHGKVEYSWLTQDTFIQVILVPGIEESNILLRLFPKVIP
jgi:hypothetical protein